MPENGLTSMWQLALERGPSLVMITGGDGRIIYVNRRFTEMTGYAPDEVIGKTPRLLQSGQTEAHVYASLWKTIQAGEPWHGEILNRRKDGSLFWEEEYIAPICDEKGGIRYYILFGNDATPRKRMEEEAGRLLSENRRLVRRMMLVEQAEREHLARELHDEMGQYLAAIKTEAVRIMAHAPDGSHAGRGAAASCAENIIADTEALFDIVHRLALRLQPDMIADMGVEAALQQLVGRWQGRTDVHCELHLAGALDRVPHVVATAAYGIVRECLTNVLKHAGARHVRIDVKRVRRHGTPCIRTSVRDDGRGMPEDAAAHLGLGIIGMRERATSLGGRLWFEHQGGYFCVFSELPIHARQEG